MEEIINKLKETVTPILEKYAAAKFNFIKKMEKYCTSEVYHITKNAYEADALKKERGYTKSMSQYFHKSKSDLKAKIKKDADAKFLSAEKAAYKKLKGVKIDTIELLHFDEMSAEWLINGIKHFSYEFIYAGGYNIQCLHFRMICKLK